MDSYGISGWWILSRSGMECLFKALKFNIVLTYFSLNLAHSMRPTLLLFVGNYFLGLTIFTRRARSIETSKLLTYCYPRLARSSLRTSGLPLSSQILNRNAIPLLALLFGWLRKSSNKLGTISKPTYGHWASLQWSLSMANHQTPARIR
jgi:hypothetical protein